MYVCMYIYIYIYICILSSYQNRVMKINLWIFPELKSRTDLLPTMFGDLIAEVAWIILRICVWGEAS